MNRLGPLSANVLDSPQGFVRHLCPRRYDLTAWQSAESRRKERADHERWAVQAAAPVGQCSNVASFVVSGSKRLTGCWPKLARWQLSASHAPYSIQASLACQRARLGIGRERLRVPRRGKGGTEAPPKPQCFCSSLFFSCPLSHHDDMGATSKPENAKKYETGVIFSEILARISSVDPVNVHPQSLFVIPFFIFHFSFLIHLVYAAILTRTHPALGAHSSDHLRTRRNSLIISTHGKQRRI